MAVTSPLGVVADCSLSIQIIHDRDEARLIPIGELDVHSASTFGVAGELAVAERPEHLHIDLSQVTFLDSSGVRGIEALIALAHRAGVRCTVHGRGADAAVADGAAVAECAAVAEGAAMANEPMVVWSGSRTRLIAVPKA